MGDFSFVIIQINDLSVNIYIKYCRINKMRQTRPQKGEKNHPFDV